MSQTATQTKQQIQQSNGTHPAPAKASPLEREHEFIPLGQSEPIKLSIALIRWMFNPRTKSGRQASDQDIAKFIALCKARLLNPFENEAYLLGYEGQDGDQWTLITSIYAFLKRAELNPAYRGIESGVIVKLADGTIEEHVGDFLTDDELLLGGWAKVYRSDRDFPNHKRAEYKRYSTAKNRWKDDPGGMIVKVAEMQALRDSFPSTLGAMFIREEFRDDGPTTVPIAATVRTLPIGRETITPKEPPPPPPAEAKQPEQETDESLGVAMPDAFAIGELRGLCVQKGISEMDAAARVEAMAIEEMNSLQVDEVIKELRELPDAPKKKGK